MPRARDGSVEAMAILDDEPDMLHLAPWLMHTSFETGVTDADIAAAKLVLTRAPAIIGSGG